MKGGDLDGNWNCIDKRGALPEMKIFRLFGLKQTRFFGIRSGKEAFRPQACKQRRGWEGAYSWECILNAVLLFA